MIGLLPFTASIYAALHLLGASPLPGPIPAEVVEVIDGDTVAVRAHIWPGQYVETRVRLAGVDTPETRRPDCEAERAAGREADAFTRAWLSDVTVVHLRGVELGSFAGRVIARLERTDGADLGADLLAAGLAVRYGEAGPWCASGASVEDLSPPR